MDGGERTSRRGRARRRHDIVDLVASGYAREAIAVTPTLRIKTVRREAERAIVKRLN